MKRRLPSIAYWAIPPLVCLLIYWPGLRAWFFSDDFVWLGLLPRIHNFEDLLRAMFRPTDHGTMRPLGDRAYFIVLQFLFGAYDSLPFRVVAFLTQFANLGLISAITHHLTKSRLAGLAAPILWLVNSKLFVIMTWSSEYILILCGFFLLLAFYLLLRHIETGETRFYLWMWFVFVLGFGAMETNVVFPLLASIYTLLYARASFRKTLPLFAVSIGYAVLHTLVAPRQYTGPYVLHVDSSIANTFWTYWRWSFEPLNLTLFTFFPGWAGPLGTTLITVALAGLTLYQVRRKVWLPLFFLAWFVITLLPVLPLRDHLSDYYLTLPLIGLAMLGAHAMACAAKNSTIWKLVAILLISGYFLEQLPVAYSASKWTRQRSLRARNLVLGVASIRHRQPGAVILLQHVDDLLFADTLPHHAFSNLGITNVYLAPGSESSLTPRPDMLKPAQFVLPRDKVVDAFRKRELLVYDAGGDLLKDITGYYVATALPEEDKDRPRRIDASSASASAYLGGSWYPAEEQAYRWMPRRATVSIGGPRNAAEKLYLSGHCPKAQVERGPLGLSVTVDGKMFSKVWINRGEAPFNFEFPLWPALVGRNAIVIELEVDRTFRTPRDTRDLGLVFGTFEIRP